MSPPQKKDHFERKGSSSSPTTFQGTKPIWDDDPFFWEAVIPPPNWSTTTTTFVGHFGIRGHPQNPNTVQKMRVRISAVLLPQKLAWQWKIHHEWRCISYCKLGVSNVMLVFSGFNLEKNTWLKLKWNDWIENTISQRPNFFFMGTVCHIFPGCRFSHKKNATSWMGPLGQWVMKCKKASGRSLISDRPNVW